MKIKTSELKDTALDWAVSMVVENSRRFPIWLDGKPSSYAAYSTDWAQGGPIIEREQIVIGYYAKIRGGLGVCATRAKVFDDKGWCLMYGETPLIAAMRCFVASKLGDEVDVPNELLG